MSTPATITSFAEKQETNLTKVAREENALARKAALERLEAGLAELKADYEMKVATLTAQHADYDARCLQALEAIEALEVKWRDASAKLCEQIESAHIVAVELIPKEQPMEEPVLPDAPPRFLLQDRKSIRQESGNFAAALAMRLAVMAMIGAAIVGFA